MFKLIRERFFLDTSILLIDDAGTVEGTWKELISAAHERPFNLEEPLWLCHKTDVRRVAFVGIWPRAWCSVFFDYGDAAMMRDVVRAIAGRQTPVGEDILRYVQEEERELVWSLRSGLGVLQAGGS